MSDDRLEFAMQRAVFAFEGVTRALESPPIAARRALDHAGLRLSIEAWRDLPIPARQRLIARGAEPQVDVIAVAEIVLSTAPPARACEPRADPDPASAPDELIELLDPGLALDPARWAALRGFDRYAIDHVYRRAVARSAFSSLSETVRAILAAASPEPEPEPEPEPREVPASPQPLSSHITEAGEVHMVDVGAKVATDRRAVARGSVRMRRATLDRLLGGAAPKGEVLATARLAGIMAAKRTHEIIPLCHLVALTHVEVALELAPQTPDAGEVLVTATVDAHDRTGCEMEAMVAVTTACLTVYDMLKGIDRDMEITDVVLIEKRGGRSGHYRRASQPGRAG